MNNYGRGLDFAFLAVAATIEIRGHNAGLNSFLVVRSDFSLVVTPPCQIVFT